MTRLHEHFSKLWKGEKVIFWHNYYYKNTVQLDKTNLFFFFLKRFFSAFIFTYQLSGKHSDLRRFLQKSKTILSGANYDKTVMKLELSGCSRSPSSGDCFSSAKRIIHERWSRDPAGDLSSSFCPSSVLSVPVCPASRDAGRWCEGRCGCIQGCMPAGRSQRCDERTCRFMYELKNVDIIL